MPLLQPDHALDVCRSLVDASPADETEVRLECTEENFVRFDQRGPTQNGDRERYHLAIRVRVSTKAGLQEARAACGSLDPDDGRAALERAMLLAQVAGPIENAQPLGGAVTVAETAAQRPTRDHTFREKASWIAQAQETCARDGLLPAGLAQTGAHSQTLVNSAGRAVHGSTSRAHWALTAFRGGEAGAGAMASCTHPNVERLDVEGTIAQAVDRAIRSHGPVDYAPQETTVVLMPPAAASLLAFAANHGLGAQEFSERNSFLCDRVGQPLFPADLRILDDAANELCPGLPFDGEGWPRERFTLLEAGCLQGPVTDDRWSRLMGVPNSGHGKSQPSSAGPAPTNLVVGAGDASVEQLIAGVEDGLMVSDLHYTNMIEPRDLTLTGMTRGGTFRIQGGRLGQPVRNLRFTMSLVNVLRRVSGIGSEQLVNRPTNCPEIISPALRVERFRFTSATDF